jgi:hypothetical protein
MATPPFFSHLSHQPQDLAPRIHRIHLRIDTDLVFLLALNPHAPDVRPMLARTPRSRRLWSPTSLRTGVDADMEALAGRRRVSEGVAAARIAYDDDNDGLRGSVLDEEGREGGVVN